MQPDLNLTHFWLLFSPHLLSSIFFLFSLCNQSKVVTYLQAASFWLKPSVPSESESGLLIALTTISHLPSRVKALGPFQPSRHSLASSHVAGRNPCPSRQLAPITSHFWNSSVGEAEVAAALLQCLTCMDPTGRGGTFQTLFPVMMRICYLAASISCPHESNTTTNPGCK